MTELDPCPFCGGKAEWDEKNKAPQCPCCKATMDLKYSKESEQLQNAK